MRAEAGEPSNMASPENPVYSKFNYAQPNAAGTKLWSILVDEGWRSWILCTGMYEWAADGLLEMLRASGKVWER